MTSQKEQARLTMEWISSLQSRDVNALDSMLQTYETLILCEAPLTVQPERVLRHCPLEVGGEIHVTHWDIVVIQNMKSSGHISKVPNMNCKNGLSLGEGLVQQ